MSMAANNTMSTIASGRVLDEAYAWLRSRRLDRSANNDFWALSLHWPTVRGELRQTLLAGDYLLSPLQMIELADGNAVSQWSAQDAIVLKALAIVLTPLLKQRLNLKAATHLKNNGGLKAAVNTAQRHSKGTRYVFKTDIANYYESMQHHTLQSLCCEQVSDKRVQRLLWQVMNRVHVRAGAHRLIANKSIPRGCPLSPLFSAVYLQAVDRYARQHKIRYVRYMDDFVFFSESRHKLRRIIKDVYSIISELGLSLSQPKTWIGRVGHGFDFLGYRISPRGLRIAQASLDRFINTCGRLYEQGADIPRLAAYVKRWIQWARSGVVLNLKQLVLTTTKILQNTFDFPVPVSST